MIPASVHILEPTRYFLTACNVLQLILGVSRLLPAPEYFPLRLRCARALNRLSEATNTFIPVAPVLLEVLQWSALHKAPQPGTGQHCEVLLQLRVSKANMRTTQYQEEIINQVCLRTLDVDRLPSNQVCLTPVPAH
jgi:nucleolar complex protein 2